MAAKSRSAKFYAENPEAREKKKKYDAALNRRPEQRKKRAELNKYNRKKGTYGNGDGKDAVHKYGRIVGFAKASKNRGDKNDSPGDRRARGGK
ncbi:MAG: hypothetical protein KBG19_04365 [Bacteroidales bacterium]|nr:hypothetical protein [Bacteroidales bacterium]